MNVHFHKGFDKQFVRLDIKIKARADKRLGLFSLDPFHKSLKNHPLKGGYLGYRSINITGDIRAIYKQTSKDECTFFEIGGHSQLYK